MIISEAQKSRLFLLSCIALTVTAMTFGIRAGILNQLGTDFGLTNTTTIYNALDMPPALRQSLQ